MSRIIRTTGTFLMIALLMTAVGCQGKNKGPSDQELAARS